MPNVTYFAYGSNLGASVLRERCPSARQLGIARLDGFRIGFTRWSHAWAGGVADLVASPASTVWGALFELHEEDLAALDEYELRPTGYDRHVEHFVSPDDAPVAAWVYRVTSPGAEIPPSFEYWITVFEGATEAGLPAHYLAQLAALEPGARAKEAS